MKMLLVVNSAVVGQALRLPVKNVNSLICHPTCPPEPGGVRERSEMPVRLGPESRE